jgi:hypothetical protein
MMQARQFPPQLLQALVVQPRADDTFPLRGLGLANFPHPVLAAHDQEFVPKVPELFLETGVFNCLVLMVTATLGALAACTDAHPKLLVKIRS